MLTTLNFELKFSFSNGAMQVTVSDHRSTLLELINVTDPLVKYSVDIMLPTKLTFTLSGKGKYDTKMDANNNIISDKYVLLSSMTLGGIPIQLGKLFDICNYSANGKTVKDTFWAFNGSAFIDFDEEDFIRWHLKNNNIFNFAPTPLTYV
jgi:hypothetical protein